MIEIYLLEQLNAVATYGTLSSAAEQLHMTQPTLTRSMKKLEDYFGFPLFDRGKKKIELNDTGKLLADYAAKILDQEKDMEIHVRNHRKSLNTLQIGSIAPGPLYTLLPECTSAYPDITIASTVDTEEAIINGLLNDEYGIIILTHPMSEEKCFSTSYVSEHLYLSISVMHPAAQKKSITFAEMDGQNFIVFSKVGIWDDIVKEQMPKSLFFKQESMEALWELRNASELPAFSTDITIATSNRSGNGRVNIPFSDETATLTYYLICKESNRNKWSGLFNRVQRQ